MCRSQIDSPSFLVALWFDLIEITQCPVSNHLASLLVIIETTRVISLIECFWLFQKRLFAWSLWIVRNVLILRQWCIFCSQRQYYLYCLCHSRQWFTYKPFMIELQWLKKYSQDSPDSLDWWTEWNLRLILLGRLNTKWRAQSSPLMLMPPSFYFGGKVKLNISRVCACRAIEKFESEARLAWICLTRGSTKNNIGYFEIFSLAWHLFRTWFWFQEITFRRKIMR